MKEFKEWKLLITVFCLVILSSDLPFKFVIEVYWSEVLCVQEVRKSAYIIIFQSFMKKMSQFFMLIWQQNHDSFISYYIHVLFLLLKLFLLANWQCYCKLSSLWGETPTSSYVGRDHWSHGSEVKKNLFKVMRINEFYFLYEVTVS